MIKKLSKGMRSPSLIQKKLRNKFRYDIQYKFDSLAYSQDNPNSNVGLVLHIGFHKRNHWTVAQSPYFFAEIIDEFDPIIIHSQSTYDKYKKQLDYIFTPTPGFAAPEIEFDSSYDTKIGLIISDPHSNTGWLEGYLDSNNIDRIFSRYWTGFFEYFPNISENRVSYLPWAVPDIFIPSKNNINMRETDGIMVFGATGNEYWYSTRETIMESPLTQKYSVSGYQNKKYTGADYYSWLSQYNAAVAAASPSNEYVLAKYFEIPAMGALLFAQSCTDLDKLGFSKENSIRFDNISEFKELAESYLDSPESHLDKRKRGVELIRNNHTIHHRIDQLKAYVNNGTGDYLDCI